MFSTFVAVSVAATNQTDGATWRVAMINRKHIDHAELLELGKLLLLLMKRQQIKLHVLSERNQRMTETEKIARAS
jgi:hypothetical protein